MPLSTFWLFVLVLFCRPNFRSFQSRPQGPPFTCFASSPVALRPNFIDSTLSSRFLFGPPNCWRHRKSNLSHIFRVAMSASVASPLSAPAGPPQASESDVSPKAAYPTLASSTHTHNHLDRISPHSQPIGIASNPPAVSDEATGQRKGTPDGRRSPNS